MDCTYSINIKGQEVTLISNIPQGEIKDVNDLLKFLKTQPNEVLLNLRQQLQSIDSIDELKLDDINENSVGIYSPNDLINSISKTVSDRSKWSKLKLGNTREEGIVIAGFGSEDTPTQFTKNHIFLNLNYMYDLDNKIIALTSLALHHLSETNPEEDFNSNVKSLMEDPENSTQLIKKLIKSNREEEINFLVDSIKLAYNKVKIKLAKDIAETNISVTRGSIQNVWNEFDKYQLDRDSNYMPKTRTRIENLKQGDLVLVPVDLQNKSTVYKSGVYEMFYDSFVDINGKTIIRTLITDENGNVSTRKRIAKVYYKDGDTTKIIESEAVDARVFNSEEFKDYNYKTDTEYSDLDVKFFKGTVGSGFIYYDSLMEILKNPQIKVVVDTISHKVKSLKGSMITLTNGSTIDITKISKVEYPLEKNQPKSKLKEEDLIQDPKWTHYKLPTIGEHIAFKKVAADVNLTEGIVLGFGNRNGEPVVLYSAVNTKGENSISYIKEKNIRFVSSPPVEYTISTSEQMDVKALFDVLFVSSGNTIQNIPETLVNKEPRAFKNSEYSIQEVNGNVKLVPKDLLLDKETGQVFKIVSSGDTYVKASFLSGDKFIYINLERKTLNNFLLFTKSPINESFAWSSIRKNRYNLYNSDRGNSVAVEVWQNPNKYTYVLPANLSETQRSEHKLYEEGAVNITEKTKKELAERYGWTEIPKNLYTNTGTAGTILKDTDNTVFIPLSNTVLSSILLSKEGLQNYIVPGSFITFSGNAKSYVVEKVYKDSILVSLYHYTANSNQKIKDPDLQYVKGEKFLLNSEALNFLKVNGLHLPKWATEARTLLSKQQDLFKKNSKLNKFSATDSPEIIMSMVDLIKEKFNVNINIIHNNELSQFNDRGVYNAAAFVTKDGIYINIDKASIEEPLHELLHLVLATLKNSDPSTYYKLVNLAQYHPMFNTIVENYDNINSELLEETFVKLLSQTFRKNILKEGVFTDSTFNSAIRKSIQDLMAITDSLSWEDPFDLLGKSINDILFDFGSKLVDNEESLIKDESVNVMFDVAHKIKNLLDSGNLIQKCKY